MMPTIIPPTLLSRALRPNRFSKEMIVRALDPTDVV
jgi:hypothetical protein